MVKLKTMVGVTTGIFNEEGKLLLRRRKEHDSITGQDYYGCWELPVVAVQETDAESIPYDYLVRELVRGVVKETGINLSDYISQMPAFYPVMFKNAKGEYDLAMITAVTTKKRPSKDKETRYVSLQELNDLAEQYQPVKKDKEGRIVQEGRGLLSGKGKRQHCMALRAFEVGCPKVEPRAPSRAMLLQIQETWK